MQADGRRRQACVKHVPGSFKFQRASPGDHYYLGKEEDHVGQAFQPQYFSDLRVMEVVGDGQPNYVSDNDLC
jgi:hypothetical protein